MATSGGVPWVRRRVSHASRRWYAVAFLGLGLLALPKPALSQVPAASASVEPKAAAASSTDSTGEAQVPWQKGPKLIDLGQELTLDLSDRYAFLERGPAAKLLEKNGSIYNDDLLGVVVGTAPGEDWFVVIRFAAEGYVKDDEAIDAEELLDTMREGQEEANKERAQRGFKALVLDSWQEPPHYAKAEHRLIWGLNVSVKNSPGVSVNYNTRILGRKGYASLNLVTDPQQLAAHKPLAHELLARTAFNPGARYEDFDKSTDKVAEYGLGGLVLAGAGLGAAKLVKIGLLAKFGKVLIALLVAGKKLLVIALVGLGAAIKGILSRNSKRAEARLASVTEESATDTPKTTESEPPGSATRAE